MDKTESEKYFSVKCGICGCYTSFDKEKQSMAIAKIKAYDEFTCDPCQHKLKAKKEDEVINV